MELSDTLHAEISRISENGNQLYDEADYLSAINEWQRALEILPEPKHQWEAYIWLNASIGDAYYALQDYKEANYFFMAATKNITANENAFIMYRLGQTYTHLNNEKLSREFLLRAYILEEGEIFKNDPDGGKYLKILQENHLI